MKTIFAASLSLLAITTASAAPSYDDAQTKRIVSEMVAAHGGYGNWRDAPSVKLDIAMYLLVLPPAEGRTVKDSWRYYTVTVDPDTSQTLVDIPWEASPGPEVGLSAERYWSRPMTFDPTYQEPPQMLGWYHYAMINLPFLTQVDGVSIAQEDAITHPYTEKSLPGFRMSFDPGPGKTHAGDVLFYIDPDTSLLTAWRFESFFPLLPGGVLPDAAPAAPASPLRIVEAHAVYDGFTLPQAYTTLMPDGNAAGTHVILDADFNGAFPVEQLIPPEDAQIVFERE